MHRQVGTTVTIMIVMMSVTLMFLTATMTWTSLSMVRPTHSDNDRRNHPD
jgi:hypothetical protein